jgi:hypothetical protein
MKDAKTEIFYRLRMARTEIALSPLGERRRATATAALQQFEELMRAAEVSGPAARPLPLFYALSQAGRAIAAMGINGDPWELQGHGLAMPGDAGNNTLLYRKVRPNPNKRDSFHQVARVTKSTFLKSAVSLEELWASLPYDMPATTSPRPLPFKPDRYSPE